MPSLKLPNPLRLGTDRPTLRQRAADLKASLSHHVSDTQPAPEPSESPAEAGDDAELLRLGAQFEVASAREIAACEACNAAQHEANRHMPERPLSLVYRASDERLNVYRHLTDPESLNGAEISSVDVERLRRIMPMTHEVLRPIRYGERAHRDHPGRKFDIVPHPEAQARAEEIVAAWDAWHAERLRIHGEHVTEALDDAANEAGDAAAALAERIAALPAQTAEGFRVKLRALAYYSRGVLRAEVEGDLPDPDQLLSHSLWRDVQGEAQQSAIKAQAQATLNRLAGADPVFALIEEHRTAYAEWDRLSDVWSEMPLSAPGYAEAVAASDGPARREIAAFDALITARPATLQGVAALAEYLREATDRTSFDLKPSAAERGLSTIADALRAVISASKQRPAPSPVDMIDFAAASLEELRALRDVADLVGGAAYATVWTDRCRIHGPSDEPNAAGKLMQWLGEALTDVETAAEKEAARRVPNNRDDRETRLSMLAAGIIENGDPEGIEELACELLAHAKVERGEG